MATQQEMFDMLAKHEVADELAREWVISPEDNARLERHQALYRERSDALARRFGGPRFYSPRG